jgi:tRNA threonylcarbamoyladenosine biosynthesis protein TsaB
MNHALRIKHVLYIDTSSNVEATVSLKLGGKEYRKTKKYNKNRAQIVLPMIQEILNKQGLRLDDIIAIEVHIGPGSFTGLRVGVAIANALGFTLNIPINNLPPGRLVEPSYT